MNENIELLLKRAIVITYCALTVQQKTLKSWYEWNLRAIM